MCGDTDLYLDSLFVGFRLACLSSICWLNGRIMGFKFRFRLHIIALQTSQMELLFCYNFKFGYKNQAEKWQRFEIERSRTYGIANRFGVTQQFFFVSEDFWVLVVHVKWFLFVCRFTF